MAAPQDAEYSRAVDQRKRIVRGLSTGIEAAVDVTNLPLPSPSSLSFEDMTRGEWIAREIDRRLIARGLNPLRDRADPVPQEQLVEIIEANAKPGITAEMERTFGAEPLELIPKATAELRLPERFSYIGVNLLAAKPVSKRDQDAYSVRSGARAALAAIYHRSEGNWHSAIAQERAERDPIVELFAARKRAGDVVSAFGTHPVVDSANKAIADDQRYVYGSYIRDELLEIAADVTVRYAARRELPRIRERSYEMARAVFSAPEESYIDDAVTFAYHLAKEVGPRKALLIMDDPRNAPGLGVSYQEWKTGRGKGIDGRGSSKR